MKDLEEAKVTALANKENEERARDRDRTHLTNSKAPPRPSHVSNFIISPRTRALQKTDAPIWYDSAHGSAVSSVVENDLEEEDLLL
jgi:hypothetical protein